MDGIGPSNLCMGSYVWEGCPGGASGINLSDGPIYNL